LYKEGRFQVAETHLLAAGNRDSARLLAEMMANWLPVDHSPGDFAVRGVVPFLLFQNILAARTFLETFLAIIRRTRPNFLASPDPITIPSLGTISESKEDDLFVTSDYTINFLQLAIRACQRGNGKTSTSQREARSAWVRLHSRYRGKNSFVSGEALTQAYTVLGNSYFGIPLPRAPGNPLKDMMASLFGDTPPGLTPGGVGWGAKRLRDAEGLD